MKDINNYKYILKHDLEGDKYIAKYKDHQARLEELYEIIRESLKKYSKFKQPEIVRAKEALEPLF